MKHGWLCQKHKKHFIAHLGDSLKTNFHLCKTFSLVTAISDHDLDNIWVEFVDFSSLSIVSKSSLSIVSILCF